MADDDQPALLIHRSSQVGLMMWGSSQSRSRSTISLRHSPSPALSFPFTLLSSPSLQIRTLPSPAHPSFPLSSPLRLLLSLTPSPALPQPVHSPPSLLLPPLKRILSPPLIGPSPAPAPALCLSISSFSPLPLPFPHLPPYTPSPSSPPLWSLNPPSHLPRISR